MEHLRAFGLSRDPFVNDPLPQFHFQVPAHVTAERRLLRCAAQGKGLCVLLGEPGSGKSLLARRLLDELEEEVFETSLLVIVHGGIDDRWLLSRIARQLGVEEPAADSIALLGQAYDQLAAFREEGRRPVVIVDDAHVLARPELMGALRALLNLEYEDQQLLTLVLVGSPALEEVMALDSGLLHRIDVKVRLGALGPDAAADYLAHRVRAAGGDPSILEPAAVAAVHRSGQGLPRAMNTLADNALFEAHLAGRGRVTGQDVERAARDLGFEAPDLAPVPEGVDEAGYAREAAVPPALEEAQVESELEEVPVLEVEAEGEGDLAVQLVEEAHCVEDVDKDLDNVFEEIIDSK